MEFSRISFKTSFAGSLDGKMVVLEEEDTFESMLSSSLSENWDDDGAGSFLLFRFGPPASTTATVDKKLG